jgi:molecular chaperone DnaJ
VTRTKSDYYEVLGLPRTADDEEIRRAFRALARELHPDVSDEPEAEERFRELSAAYSVLSTPSARFLYDRFGYRGRGNGAFGPRGRRGRSRVVAEVQIDYFEVARGTRREVRYLAEEECEACSGQGGVPGTTARPCTTCGGKGRVRVSSGLGVGRWLQIEPCHDCAGLGRIFEQACPECRGVGHVMRPRVVKVRIPAGVEDGTRLRVMGEHENEHLVVRVTPEPNNSRLIRWTATALLAFAVALLLYFIYSY